LRLRSTAPSEEPPPGQEPPGIILDEQVKRLTADGGGLEGEARLELQKLLPRHCRLPPMSLWHVRTLSRIPSYGLLIKEAVEPLTDYRLAIARALFARCIELQREASDTPEGFVSVAVATRDRIVELLVAALGGREAGVVDWVKRRARRLVEGMATSFLARKRGRVSSAITPFAADIVMYQTRPHAMREFIHQTIRDTAAAARARRESGEVIVIAHSLGGIAVVDALIEKPLPAVRHLITVGSQAPLLYELDALSSLPFNHGVAEVHTRFPNIFLPRG